MKTKLFIAFLVIATIIAGYFWINRDKKSHINITKSDANNKEVAFEMSYKGMSFNTTVKHGGIRRQIINGYTFQAITEGNNIILSIKSPDGEIIESKQVTFNG